MVKKKKTSSLTRRARKVVVPQAVKSYFSREDKVKNIHAEVTEKNFKRLKIYLANQSLSLTDWLADKIEELE